MKQNKKDKAKTKTSFFRVKVGFRKDSFIFFGTVFNEP